MIAAVFTQCIENGKFNDEALKLCKMNSSDNVQVVLIDNGSPEPINSEYADITIRTGMNLGGNKIPHYFANLPVVQGGAISSTRLMHELYDVICFFHADLMIVEHHWDMRLFNLFKEDKSIILAGFVGSTEMDSLGGRGAGTISNFQGLTYSIGKGATWRDTGGFEPGKKIVACLDHCAMCYRSSYINNYDWFYLDPPPMDFEDKYISCETIAAGMRIGYIGIACDHVSGAKGQCSGSFKTVCTEWLDRHGIIIENDPSYQVYLESEKIFLNKWKEKEGLIPFSIL